ncbi:MAG TPA: hypothetical protein VM243_10030 [Phycisphaerae bacterium]|nr:hypothetical protein [Phycisphaerae bacterium]
MRPPRRLLRQAVLRLLAAAVLYILLMLGWLWWSEGYARALRSVGNFVFARWYDGAAIRFEPQAVEAGTYAATRMQDTRLSLMNHATRARGNQPVSSQYIGYVPTVLFLALVLPSPVPWRRRWKAVLWGFVLIGAFILLRMWLMIFNAFCSDSPLALFYPSDFWRRVLAFATETLTRSLTTCFVVPLAIWVLVCFRHGDLAALRGSGRAKTGRATHGDQKPGRAKRRTHKDAGAKGR